LLLRGSHGNRNDPEAKGANCFLQYFVKKERGSSSVTSISAYSFMHKIIKNWIISFLVSFLFAWLASYIFSDSVSPKVYDQEVGRYVLASGTKVRKRSEGWAVTHVGPHGVTGVALLADLNKPAIAIWGDSYIEGFNVPDKAKAGALITADAEDKGVGFVGVNIGMSGQSIADYYFAIPKYEKIFNIARHYIVLPNMADALPDNDSAHLSQFVSNPELGMRFKAYRQAPHWRLKSWLHGCGLDFLWDLVKDASQIQWRFIPESGQRVLEGTSLSHGSFPPNSYAEVWNFLLSAMAQTTTKPITYVYCPAVPLLLRDGVQMTDADRALAEKFASLCHERGIDFINLEKEFINLYEASGRFPRGFANSRPSYGHMNVDGHRILAEAIFQHFSEFGI